MSEQARRHYDRLASDYDAYWAHSRQFVHWMSSAIESKLFPADRRVEWAADIGCGTGLFTPALAQRAHRVVCADPSAKMLARIPTHPAVQPIQASAEDIVVGRVLLPHPRFDAVLVKEAIHHVDAADRPDVIAGLARLLAPSRRLLVVMLPLRIEYPLFPAALELFERLQPDPQDIAEMMHDAGLSVDLGYAGFGLSFPRQRYVEMVRNRYMSLLSHFDDAELEAGIAQMDPERETYDFADRFAFIAGRREVE